MTDIAIDRKRITILVLLLCFAVSLISCGVVENVIETDFYELDLPEGWSYEVKSEELGTIDCMNENNEVMFQISPHDVYSRDGYSGNLEALVRQYGMHYFLLESEQIFQGEDYSIEKLKVYVEPSAAMSARGEEPYEEWFFWVLTDNGIELNFCNFSEDNLDEIEEIVKVVQMNLEDE